MQKIILIGRLGDDPLLKDGPTVCTFSVAVSKTWTDKEGKKQDKTTWFQIQTWNKMAENCHKYLSKGSQVYVEAEMDVQKWQDKEGNPRQKSIFNALAIQFLDSKPREENDQQYANRTTGDKTKRDYQPEINNDYAEDEIPF